MQPGRCSASALRLARMVGALPALSLARCVMLWQRHVRGTPVAGPWPAHRRLLAPDCARLPRPPRRAAALHASAAPRRCRGVVAAALPLAQPVEQPAAAALGQGACPAASLDEVLARVRSALALEQHGNAEVRAPLAGARGERRALAPQRLRAARRSVAVSSRLAARPLRGLAAAPPVLPRRGPLGTAARPRPAAPGPRALRPSATGLKGFRRRWW